MPDEELTVALKKLFAEKMLVEVGSAEEDLIQAGVLDSLRLAELLLHLEETFGFQVAMEELEIEDLRSVASIARMIQRQRDPVARRERLEERPTARLEGGVSIPS